MLRRSPEPGFAQCAGFPDGLGIRAHRRRPRPHCTGSGCRAAHRAPLLRRGPRPWRASIPRATRLGRQRRRPCRRRPVPWPGNAGALMAVALRAIAICFAHSLGGLAGCRFLRCASLCLRSRHPARPPPRPPATPEAGPLEFQYQYQLEVSSGRLVRRASRCAWWHAGRGVAAPRVRGRAARGSRRACCAVTPSAGARALGCCGRLAARRFSPPRSPHGAPIHG
jgi:hypothetical protein